MPASAAAVQQGSVRRRSAEQHGVEAPQRPPSGRDRRAPAAAGWAPPTGSAGRPRSGRSWGGRPGGRPPPTTGSVGHQRADQHHQAGDVVRRQGQHPAAGPAEPAVGGLGRGDQRRPGQDHAARAAGRARGRDDGRRVRLPRRRPRVGASPGSAPARRDRPAAGRSRRHRPDCGGARPAPRRCRRRGGAGRSRLPPYAVGRAPPERLTTHHRKRASVARPRQPILSRDLIISHRSRPDRPHRTVHPSRARPAAGGERLLALPPRRRAGRHRGGHPRPARGH